MERKRQPQWAPRWLVGYLFAPVSNGNWGVENKLANKDLFDLLLLIFGQTASELIQDKHLNDK